MSDEKWKKQDAYGAIEVPIFLVCLDIMHGIWRLELKGLNFTIKLLLQHNSIEAKKLIKLLDEKFPDNKIFSSSGGYEAPKSIYGKDSKVINNNMIADIDQLQIDDKIKDLLRRFWRKIFKVRYLLELLHLSDTQIQEYCMHMANICLYLKKMGGNQHIPISIYVMKNYIPHFLKIFRSGSLLSASAMEKQNDEIQNIVLSSGKQLNVKYYY
jgi:hypothetical protein